MNRRRFSVPALLFPRSLSRSFAVPNGVTLGAEEYGGVQEIGFSQQVASILTCPQDDATSADQTSPSSRPRMLHDAMWVTFTETRCQMSSSGRKPPEVLIDTFPLLLECAKYLIESPPRISCMLLSLWKTE